MLELASRKPRMPLFHNVAACISQAKNAIVLSCWSLHFISQECPCRIFNSGMVIYVVLHEQSHCRLTRSMTIFHATFCNNLPPGLVLWQELCIPEVGVWHLISCSWEVDAWYSQWWCHGNWLWPSMYYGQVLCWVRCQLSPLRQAGWHTQHNGQGQDESIWASWVTDPT